MPASDAKGKSFSRGEEDSPLYFGEWLQRRRRELDLTQSQLAVRACCSVFTIRKIELGERRPSRQLAGLLAQVLEIPGEIQATFIKVARGELSLERLPTLARATAPDPQPASQPGLSIGNLPRALTPFIGREPELSALGELLRDPQCSLLTVAGAGGIGKTRLAIEAADQSKALFPDGVWFVPLAALKSPAQLVPAIAHGLAFRFHDPNNPQAQLLRYLGGKQALLILDNAEHLLEGAGLFAEILSACSQVKLLVTSRERLSLSSEWVFEVQGLPVPAGERVEQFEAYSAVALFLQSARRVQAGFELGEAERCWVLKICQIVEGLPLGIELAAAWVGLLPCKEIAIEIERNIDFLTVALRDLPERHRSLRATLDHSWKLLNPEERQILSRLAVFHGSFRREAAEEICGASLAVLSSLRNKMLLHRTGQDFYGLHELIRQYAERKLSEDPGEDEQVKDRHAACYVRCLSEWEQALQSSRQTETFDEIAQVIDNLSRGWQRMVTRFHPETLRSGQFCPGLFRSSLFSLSLFYEMRMRSLEVIPVFKESVAYLKSVQSAFEKSGDRAIYYAVLGQVTAYLGLHHANILEYEQGRAYLEEAIGYLGIGPSRVEGAQAQVMLASIDQIHGHLQKAVAMLEESREVFRQAGEIWWTVLTNVNLAPAYVSIGRHQESEELLRNGLEVLEPGDFRLGFPLRNYLAFILGLRKDFDGAEQYLQQNLRLCNQMGTFAQTSSVLFELGRVALATRQIELAEAYFQKSIDIVSESGQFYDLSWHWVYLGKCFASRVDQPAARERFRQAIKCGRAMDRPYVVYSGLVNIARTYKDEGQPEKALEISLALRHYPVEFIRVKDEGDRLLAELQAELPQWQIEATLKQIEGETSLDQAVAKILERELGS